MADFCTLSPFYSDRLTFTCKKMPFPKSGPLGVFIVNNGSMRSLLDTFYVKICNTQGWIWHAFVA